LQAKNIILNIYFTAVMNKFREISLLLLLLIIAVSLKAQDNVKDPSEYTRDLVQFTGVVVTGDSLKPIPFTNIVDQNTGHGTISDYFGYFSFVARKGDSILFSSMGFKKSIFIIPDTITNNRYTMFQVMNSDTIYLSETVIYPWPTKEQFKDAFLNMQIPDDDLVIARKNLEKSEMAARADAMPMNSSMNYRYYVDQRIDKLYYAGQTQPITILNPFAWAQFFKAWKEGKFKRKKYED
jgi:hypothetical protein